MPRTSVSPLNLLFQDVYILSKDRTYVISNRILKTGVPNGGPSETHNLTESNVTTVSYYESKFNTSRLIIYVFT